ncbi:hypothetical protein KP509_25G018300 [Ceratopteris richardii]|uniref:Ion transport domain-containing protein n=1 Tax=Ceratopteris richardii TaxID=49495 RepID=A0A8T2RR38_CERRI|nr:hypothetical protein KP509_25G018300 [Ceratopteris richardii]
MGASTLRGRVCVFPNSLYSQKKKLVDYSRRFIGTYCSVLYVPHFLHVLWWIIIELVLAPKMVVDMRLNILGLLNLVALIVLNFFELPLWCEGSASKPCGRSRVFSKSLTDQLKVVLMIVLGAGIIVYALYAFSSGSIINLSFRLAPYLRVMILVIDVRTLRECVKTAVAIGKVLDIVVLSILVLLFSSVLVFVLFEDTEQVSRNSFGEREEM